MFKSYTKHKVEFENYKKLQKKINEERRVGLTDK